MSRRRGRCPQGQIAASATLERTYITHTVAHTQFRLQPLPKCGESTWSCSAAGALPAGWRVLGRMLYAQLPHVKRPGNSGGFAELDDNFEF
eukprot:6175600-Pleurochrysis_carterae.AAC.1